MTITHRNEITLSPEAHFFTNPENADRLMTEGDKRVAAKFDLYQKLAGLEPCSGEVPKAE